MTTTIPTNAELAQELAALRAQLTPAPKRRRARRFSPRRLASLGVVALLVALVPFSILAADIVITDLNDAAPEHRSNIQAIGVAGITTGFDDPNSSDPNVRVYYPKDNVTREEMASFLARLGGFGGNPPIANAKTAQTAQGVAPGAITPAGISAAGSTPGQVLTSTGDGVAFQNPPVGPTGPTGPAGAQGPQGPQGAPGVGVAVLTGTPTTATGTPTTALTTTVLCAPGSTPIIGGGSSTNPLITVSGVRPVTVPGVNGLEITFANPQGLTGTQTGFAICTP